MVSHNVFLIDVIFSSSIWQKRKTNFVLARTKEFYENKNLKSFGLFIFRYRTLHLDIREYIRTYRTSIFVEEVGTKLKVRYGSKI